MGQISRIRKNIDGRNGGRKEERTFPKAETALIALFSFFAGTLVSWFLITLLTAVF